MKKMILAGAISGLFSLAIAAQTPTPPPRSTPAGQAKSNSAPCGGGGAEGKIAHLNSTRFGQGIDELKVKLESFNLELEPKIKEVQGLEEEINSLKNKLQT